MPRLMHVLVLVPAVSTLIIAETSAATYSLWDASATPATLTYPDRVSVELGVKFRSDIDGLVH
jgi:hypothetical protein